MLYSLKRDGQFRSDCGCQPFAEGAQGQQKLTTGLFICPTELEGGIKCKTEQRNRKLLEKWLGCTADAEQATNVL